MKTIVLGLIFLGFTSLMHAQNEMAYVNVTIDEPTSPVKNLMINSNYYKSLDGKITSNKIREFQKVVARYDIKSADIYTPAYQSNYTVVFEEGENQIKAEYNKDGKIVNCSEFFKNIRLPYSISSDIAKNYPGWEFTEVLCNITYDSENNLEVIYKVEIKNGDTRKSLKLNTADYNL